MIRTAIAAAALAGMAASTTTSAQTTEDAPTVHVHHTDLDLSQPDDMKVLRHRVAMAVNTVCPLPVGGSMDDIIAHSRCRKRAIKGADRQIAALVATPTYAQADTRRARIQP